jgi:multidrug efflux pump
MISATILAIIFVPAFFVFVLGVLKTKRPEQDHRDESIASSAPRAAVEAEYSPGSGSLP